MADSGARPTGDEPTLKAARTRLAEARRLYRAGDLDGAAAQCDAVLALRPENVHALQIRGGIAIARDDPAAALDWFDRAIALNPFDADILALRAGALAALGRNDAAYADFDRAIAIAPDNRRARFNMARMLVQARRFVDALAALDAALAIDPDYAEAHNLRGSTLRALGRFDEALASYDRALAINPRFALPHSNKGVTLHDLKRHKDALACLDAALAIDPGDAQARFNKSVALLLNGDFVDGWPLYESRLTLVAARRFDVPQWRGDSSLQGKTILLHAEQGFGDVIQFCRYARLAAEQGARVVLEVRRPLVALMGSLAGVDAVVARGEPLPVFELHCPLLSLPLAFATDLATIPAEPRYLDSDPDRRAAWAAELGDAARPRIGLAWSGNADNARDARRSLPLDRLLRHLPDGLDYIALQPDVRDTDAATLAQHPAIRHPGRRLDDFAETAALCDLCDAVVSVDTAVAHLAGALGRPTFIPISFVPDWRWLLDRDDSPWYPSVRLFRQPAWGDWDGALRGIAAQLATLRP